MSVILARRRSEEPEETADAIVPPVAVAMIDQLLLDLPAPERLMTSRQVADLLLDIRNSLWVPNPLSMAVTGVLDTKAADPRRKRKLSA